MDEGSHGQCDHERDDPKRNGFEQPQDGCDQRDEQAGVERKGDNEQVKHPPIAESASDEAPNVIASEGRREHYDGQAPRQRQSVTHDQQGNQGELKTRHDPAETHVEEYGGIVNGLPWLLDLPERLCATARTASMRPVIGQTRVANRTLAFTDIFARMHLSHHL